MKNWLIKLVALFLLLPFASLSLAAQVTYYDTNNVGTPVAMWDAGARKVWETEYYPFGKEYQTSTAIKNNDRKFVGKEKDKETDLTYFGARYYDDLSGRFLAPDPVRPVDALTSKTWVYGLWNTPSRKALPGGRWRAGSFLACAYTITPVFLPAQCRKPWQEAELRAFSAVPGSRSGVN